jgi:hypothetical protein
LGIDMRMATYDLDPDVTLWGLHLLDVTQYENAYVENDEAVARALQEEFTRVDSLEAFGVSNVGEENMQASVLAQDWFCPSKRHYSTGNETLAATVLTVVCFRVISCFSYCNRLPTICRE